MSAEPAVFCPVWMRLRLWVALAAVLVLGALLLGTLLQSPARALDPASTNSDGSKALVRVLDTYGVRVSVTSGLDTALGASDAAVVVTSPDDYSDAQLHRLASSARRVVFVRPGTRASAAVVRGLSPDTDGEPGSEPDCDDAGAQAAGTVQQPDDATRYVGAAGGGAGAGATSCYRGVLVTAGPVVVLGSAKLLQNGTLARTGVAALDVNAITDGRDLGRVVWLLPGGDAGGSGPASVWDLFPDGVYRAFWFVVAFGVLLVVWRARRLGGVVREPLPVVVRAAEIIEGHGRLYLRAGARDRAAAALRSATVARVTARLTLPRGTDARQVAHAVAPVLGRDPAAVTVLFDGPAPDTDAALVRLATDLERLEAALGATIEGNAR